jgi:hypothetical protein
MIEEKPYSYKLNDGTVIKVSLEEFRRITNFSSWCWNTTETITLTIIDYDFNKNFLIAKTEKAPIFNDRCKDYHSGIVAFDPFVGEAISLEDGEYYIKKKALSCIGHTFKILTNTNHYWGEYKGKKIIEYVPRYEDIKDTSWEGRQ